MLYSFLAGVGFTIVIFVLAVWFFSPDRNKKLISWTQTVPLTDLQKQTMRHIWEGHLSSKDWLGSFALIKDINSEVSPEDWDYILKICQPDFRPDEFGDCKNLFNAHCKYLVDKGYAVEIAQIVNGMKLNGLVKRLELENKTHKGQMKAFEKKFGLR